MSMCAGAAECEIYRDKKFCRKAEEKQNDRGQCDCRHARRACEVGPCIMENICQMKKEGFE